MLLENVTLDVISPSTSSIAKTPGSLKELFNPITSFFFKFLGGIPVDRNRNENLVDAVVNLFKTNKIEILAIAPEGTRKKVNKWKTGFYYIALKTKLPILMVSFDYNRKEVKINNGYYPTGNIETDIAYLEHYFIGVTGKNPELSYVPKLK